MSDALLEHADPGRDPGEDTEGGPGHCPEGVHPDGECVQFVDLQVSEPQRHELHANKQASSKRNKNL